MARGGIPGTGEYLTMTFEQRVEQLRSLSEDDLYAHAGAEVLGGGMNLSGQDLVQAIAVGRRALRESVERCRQEICASTTVELYRQGGKFKDTMFLAAGLSDLIAAKVIGVAPLTVAVYAIGIGLETLCGENQ